MRLAGAWRAVTNSTVTKVGSSIVVYPIWVDTFNLRTEPGNGRRSATLWAALQKLSEALKTEPNFSMGSVT